MSDGRNTSMPDGTVFSIGSTVFGRYEILGVVAEGAQGRVYKALDTVLNNNVALKVLVSNLNDKEMLRFQTEAKLASKMKHYNIATIYDFGLSDGTPFLSMEFVEGETLSQRLKSRGTLGLREFCAVFNQVCDALVHAHNNGIVHRDIKPSNIAISHNFEGHMVVKVLDFGVAKNVENVAEEGRMTPTGNLVGTPHYMSPEQVQGQKVTTRSDNYALGCVMWHAVAGAPPFNCDTAMETFMHHIHAAPEGLHDAAPEGFPEKLLNLIEELLSKRAEDRPDIAEVVKPALEVEQYVPDAAEEGTAHGDTAGKVPWKPNLAVIVSCAIFICVAVVGALFVSNNASKETLPTVDVEKIEGSAMRDLIVDVGDRHAEKEKTILETGEIDQGGRIFLPNCTDEALKKLRGNKKILKVDLSGSRVTDKGLIHLSAIPNLGALVLTSTDVKTLEGLEKCKQLEWLEMKMTKIDDAALERLLVNKRLRLFKVNECPNITDKAVETISKFPAASEIDLTGTKITNNATKYLLNVKNLYRVKLRRTAIDEAHARQILSKTGIQIIELDDCPGITEERMEVLRRDYPLVSFSGDASLTYKLQEQIADLVKHKDMVGAKKEADRLVAIIEKAYGPNNAKLGEALLQSAQLANVVSGSVETGKAYEKLAALYERKSDFKPAAATYELASNYFLRSKDKKWLERGVQLAELSCKIDEEKNDRNSPDLSSKMLNLGIRYRSLGKFDKALYWTQKGKDIRERISGARHPETAVALIHLGECNRGLLKLPAAKSNYKTSLSILEARYKDKGDYAAHLVSCYAGLADVSRGEGKVKEAIEFCEKAIEFSKTKNTHVPLDNKAVIYAQYGNLLRIAGRKDESDVALARYEKLMEMHKRREAAGK